MQACQTAYCEVACALTPLSGQTFRSVSAHTWDADQYRGPQRVQGPSLCRLLKVNGVDLHPTAGGLGGCRRLHGNHWAHQRAREVSRGQEGSTAGSTEGMRGKDVGTPKHSQTPSTSPEV